MGDGYTETQEEEPPPGPQDLTATQRFDISQGPAPLAVFF